MAKQPDYKLFAKKKDAKHGAPIGAGWSNDWGGISLKLNPCVQLSDRDDIYITLYPARDQQQERFDQQGPPAPRNWDGPPPMDDDVPF